MGDDAGRKHLTAGELSASLGRATEEPSAGGLAANTA